MPQAMRIPVKEPGPWPKANASMVARARGAARASTRRIIGTRRSACWFGARTSSTKSSSPRSRAAEHSSVEVSTARRFKAGAAQGIRPL